jgi:hypothetical protein
MTCRETDSYNFGIEFGRLNGQNEELDQEHGADTADIFDVGTVGTGKDRVPSER